MNTTAAPFSTVTVEGLPKRGFQPIRKPASTVIVPVKVLAVAVAPRLTAPVPFLTMDVTPLKLVAYS